MHPALAVPYEPLAPDNCALLMIGHQMGLMLTTQTMPLEQLRRNTIGLARIAKLFGIPVVVTSGGAAIPGGRGFNGPLFPEIAQILPDAVFVDRTAGWRVRSGLPDGARS